MEVVEGVIGKKGEIYVKKRLREILNLKPGDKVEFVIKDNTVLFRKKKSATDLLRAKKAKISLKELMEARRELEAELTNGT